MKKNDFVRLVLGVVGGLLFSVGLCMCLLLPLALLFVFINTNVTQELEHQASRTVLETLKQAKTPLISMVSDADYTSKEILGSDAVQDYLGMCLIQSPDEIYHYRYKVDLFLAQLLDSRDYIERAALFSNGEMVVQSGAYLQEDALPAETESLELDKTGLHWLPARDNQAYMSRHERGQEVVLLRSVNDVQTFGVMLGVEKLSIHEDYICSLYSGIAANETENMLLIDDDGNVISSMDKTCLGTNTAGQHWYSGVREGNEGWFVSDGKLITYCRLNTPGWVLVRIDAQTMVAHGKLVSGVILMSIALTLPFATVFFIIQRRNIIRPIMELSEEIRGFHDGNYTFTERQNAQDEIGVLNRACVEMGKYIQDLIERVYKSQLAEKETQLMYLQSQINPHFLYNTLDSIRWMAIRNRQMDIAKQTQALAQLLKHALNGGSENTTVREELKHLQDYITIQTNRFGDRIEVIVQADEEALNCSVLNLVLQPLVENAFVHGLENKIGHGIIEVRVSREGDVLTYSVADNGLGADPEPVRRALRGEEPEKNALALTNINKRLKYKYGEEHMLRFNSEPGKGTTVIVTMPAQEVSE